MKTGKVGKFLNSLFEWSSLSFGNLSKRTSAKFNDIIEEQKYINQLAGKVFKDYESKLHKINSLILENKNEQDLLRIIALIKVKQAELRNALNRSEIAIMEISDLEREFMDWQRAKGLRHENIDDANSRESMLRTELFTRGRVGFENFYEQLSVVNDQQPELDLASERKNIVFTEQCDEPALFQRSTDIDEEGVSLDVDDTAMIQNIRDLHRELAKLQSSMTTDSNLESLRVAKDIKNKYAFLKQQDRVKRKKRDRLAIVEDIKHLFSVH